ncbi:ROK family protein [Rhizobium binxianense]
MAVTTQLLRHINAMRILRLLRRGAGMSRADIARELGLTRATVGNAMVTLLGSGLVMEGVASQAGARVGRPGVEVMLDPKGAFSIGVEIGMRSISVVIIDLVSRVVAHRADRIGDFRDPDELVKRILQIVRELRAEAAVPADRISGIGVAIPGLVDKDGVVVNAPFLEWRRFPIRDGLAAALPADWLVRIQNDASAFAAAERAAGLNFESEDLLLVLMTEGIGGALVREGRVVGGGHGYAGEIGHTIVTAGGQTDTFEMLAGFAYFEKVSPADKTVAEAVAAILARRGEKEIAAMLDLWGETLALGLANAVHLLDPRQIVLGGPLAQLYPAVEKRVVELLDKALIYGFARPPIRLAAASADGAAIGAATIVQDTIFDLPLLENGGDSIPYTVMQGS